jgi:Nuclease-related domain
MAWPKLRSKSSAQLMTADNHSRAAHDGARSQDNAPEGAPGGPAGEPVRGTEGFNGAEGGEGPEVLHGTVVTWPAQAGDEATTVEVTGQEPEPESGDLPLWDWSPPADRPAEERAAEEPPAEREDPPKPEWKAVVTPVEEADPGPGRRRGTLSQLASHPRMRVWQLRALAAVIVMVAFSILVSWKLGLTLAVIVVIADTIYRARKGYASKVKLTAAQRHTRRQLTKLGRAGYRAMHASPIPDSEDQIDHLVVGPAGVFAIDSEDWDKRLIVRTKSGKQLFHGPFSQKDRLEHARWEAQRASDLLSGEVGKQVAVRPAMAVYGPKVPWDVATIREVDVFSGPRLRKYLRRRARNGDVRPLTDDEIDRIFTAANKAFPHLSSGSPAG